jgi:hypothetical protein
LASCAAQAAGFFAAGKKRGHSTLSENQNIPFSLSAIALTFPNRIVALVRLIAKARNRVGVRGARNSSNRCHKMTWLAVFFGKPGRASAMTEIQSRIQHRGTEHTEKKKHKQVQGLAKPRPWLLTNAPVGASKEMLPRRS